MATWRSSGWVVPPNGYHGYRVRLDLTIDSMDIEDNSHDLDWVAYLEADNNGLGFRNYNSSSGYVDIDGTRRLTIPSSFPTSVWNGIIEIGRGSITVEHDPDGTKKLNFAAAFNGGNTGWAPGAMSLSNSWVLPTIPRATTPTFSPEPAEVGQSVFIGLPRASELFTHDVTYELGGASGTIATGAGVSTSWTPPTSLLPHMIDRAAADVAITVVTKNGATVIGTKTVQLAVEPPGGVPYVAPAVSATVQRALADGTPATEGTALRVNIDAAVASVIVGTEQNALTYKVRTRVLNSPTWFEVTDTLVAGIAFVGPRTFTDSDGDPGTQPFLTTSSYEVEVEASDELGSTRVWGGLLAPAAALLAVDKASRSVSVGRLYDAGLGGGLQVHGERVPLGPYEREVTTASVAVNATWQGTVPIGRTAFTLIQVETSSPARVRLHASAAHRTADLARPFGVPPSGFDHGVLADIITEVSDTGPHEVNPTMVGGSLEDPPSASFPITIERLSGSTGPLTAELTVI